MMTSSPGYDVMSTEIGIRLARLDDAGELARLVGELGYTASRRDIEQRLERILETEHQVVHVAAGSRPETLAGWIEVVQHTVLESGYNAEIVGLVVDRRARRSGIGRALVSAAVNWASARGLHRITVRTNIRRGEAHPFYQQLGFARSKTQHVYVKRL